MTSIKEVLVLHHSHLDVGYTHPQPTLWELQCDYIDQAIDLCEQTEDWPEECQFRWTCEATAPVLKWLESASSRQFERFEKLLRAGKISIAAMNLHTTPLCNAEQIARILYPIRTLRETFGINLNTAINHDVNGQPWPLSQLLIDSGIDLYITGINTHFGGIPMPRPRAFWWEAPDKRRLLSFLGEHYSIFTQMTKLWEKDTRVMEEGLSKYLQRIVSEGYPYDFVYLTATNVPMLDNTPPDYDLASLIRTWNADNRELKIRFTTPELLLERLRTVDEGTIPTYSGDWTDYWNFGAGSSALETKLNRRTKQVMQTTDLLAIAKPNQSKRLTTLQNKVWNSVNLYDEHTWGASESVSQPDSIATMAQWAHKSHYAYEANSLACYLFGKKMDAFCGNSPQSDGVEGIMFINSTGAKVIHDLRLSADLTDSSRSTLSSRLRSLQGERDVAWDSESYGLVTVPPYSWRVIPVDQLMDFTQFERIQISGDVIETPYYRIRLDETSGNITEIHDKELDWNIIDKSSPWTFFQLVRESMDGSNVPNERRTLFDRDIEKCNNSISCWNHDWPRHLEAAHLLRAHLERHPNGISIVMTGEAPGVEELEQRITFFTYKPGIELTARFRKLDVRTPEAIYFAFPLSMEAWQAKYDSAGMFITLDHEQLPGSCRDWLTVDQTISVFDSMKGVTLACPDAPLVQVGGFNFGKESKTISREENPLLLGWALNNYWDTNFRASQPGLITLKYELSTFRQFSPVQAWSAGISAQDPIEVWPVDVCQKEYEGTFFDIRGKGLTVSYIKMSEDGRGIIVRVRNHLDHQVTGEMQFSGNTVKSAFITTVLEEPRQPLTIEQGVISLALAPQEFLTIQIVTE